MRETKVNTQRYPKIHNYTKALEVEPIQLLIIEITTLDFLLFYIDKQVLPQLVAKKNCINRSA